VLDGRIGRGKLLLTKKAQPTLGEQQSFDGFG
jgi:hypothetical protein